MGIAERFKQKLNNVNIFNEGKEEKVINSSTTTPTNQTNPLKSEEDKTLCVLDEKLVTELKLKIKNTPYWNEYGKDRQLKMIRSYFNKRIQNNIDLPENNDIIKQVFDIIKNMEAN